MTGYKGKMCNEETPVVSVPGSSESVDAQLRPLDASPSSGSQHSRYLRSFLLPLNPEKYFFLLVHV